MSTLPVQLVEAQKPVFAEAFARFTRTMFERMTKALGAELKHVYSSQYASLMIAIRGCLSRDGEEKFRPTGPYRINEDKLAKEAERYAADAVQLTIAKLNTKLGELDTAKLERLDHTTFRITGTLGQRHVVIEQTVVVNTSKHGRPYLQFPARIYVNNKFTSAAAYAKLRGG